MKLALIILTFVHGYFFEVEPILSFHGIEQGTWEMEDATEIRESLVNWFGDSKNSTWIFQEDQNQIAVLKISQNTITLNFHTIHGDCASSPIREGMQWNDELDFICEDYFESPNISPTEFYLFDCGTVITIPELKRTTIYKIYE